MEIISEETIEIANDFLAGLSEEQGPEYYDKLMGQQPYLTALMGFNFEKIKDKESNDTFIQLVSITFQSYRYYNLSFPVIKEKNIEFTVKKWVNKIKSYDPNLSIALIHKFKQVLFQTNLFDVYDLWIFGTPEELSSMKKKDQVFMYSTLMILVDLFNIEVNKFLPPEEIKSL